MKYIVINDTKKKYPNIMLENLEDLELFIKYDSIIRSKQAANFWIGFKSSWYKNNPGAYAQHEVSSKNNIAYLLALKLDLSGKTTSLSEYCSMADNILIDKYKSMQKYIAEGYTIKVNDRGGYCPSYINEQELFKYENIEDITDEQQVLNFILCGSLESPMVINRRAIIIENADYVSNHLIDKFTNATKIKSESIQRFTGFKLNTMIS